MNEDPAASAGKPRRSLLTWALWGVALIGVAAVVYIMVQAGATEPRDTPGARSAGAAATSSLAGKLTRPAQPTPAPDYVFYDAGGEPRRIADFKGKVVVMNLWATWCAPCKVEMPTLAKLAAAYKDKGVEVAPISIDSPDAVAAARIFIARNDPLVFYHDRDAKLPFRLAPVAAGMPTTVIYGRDGLEVARVSGEADWTGPEARALIDKALAAR